VTKVIEAPPSLDDTSFEQIFEALAPLPPDEKVLIDARRTRWASPYGLTALLSVAQTRLQRPALTVPELEDTTSYWARAHFFPLRRRPLRDQRTCTARAQQRGPQRPPRGHSDHQD
jgi:hypothetical protein